MQTVTYIAQMDMEHELTSLRDNEFLPTAVEEQSLPVSWIAIIMFLSTYFRRNLEQRR